MPYIGAGIQRFNTADGLTVNGDAEVTGTVNPSGDTASGDAAAVGFTSTEGLILTGQGSTSDITVKNDADAVVFSVPTGTDDILFPDNAKAIFGAGSDLELSHNGTNSIIEGKTGDLIIRTAGTESIFLQDAGGNNLAQFNDNSDVKLYHNANEKLATTSGGVSVTGVLFTNTVGRSDDTNTTIDFPGSDVIQAFTAGNERARFDANGHLIRGRTAAFTSGGSDTGGTGSLMIATDGARSLFLLRSGSNGEVVNFIRGGVTNPVGTISITTTATAYNTSSDHRLKENVADMTGAIDRVKALAPKRFNFIADADTTVDGFLAHEAQAVVPEAVTGTKDEVETWTQQEIDDGDAPDGTSAGDNKLDGDGNTIPVMQGIDQAKLVPLLTAALKESIAKIETLETEMTALKARVTTLEGE